MDSVAADMASRPFLSSDCDPGVEQGDARLDLLPDPGVTRLYARGKPPAMAGPPALEFAVGTGGGHAIKAGACRREGYMRSAWRAGALLVMPLRVLDVQFWRDGSVRP